MTNDSGTVNWSMSAQLRSFIRHVQAASRLRVKAAMIRSEAGDKWGAPNPVASHLEAAARDVMGVGNGR